MRHVALAVLGWLLAASIAEAQPQLSVSATEVPGGGTVTVTVNATPGLFLAIVGSTRDGGVAYGGVTLNIGADLRVLFAGFVPATGTVSLPFTPPLANGLDVYYLMAVTSTSADFVPPTPSATVALRQRGFYTFAPNFPQGLAAGGARITSVGLPVIASDAASKAYVDASQFRLGPPTPQGASTTTPLISTEQQASGDLLSLRTNSTTFPGSLNINPNRVQFRILPDGGFFARGTAGVGVIPITGPGERLMWFPGKAAFRVGSTSPVGTEWDDANIGFYSAASGFAALASGNFSFAHGEAVRATNAGAVALGGHVLAAGGYGVAMGRVSGACANMSVALGHRASTSSAPTDAEPCGGTLYSGSFALGDGSAGINQFVVSTANNQFVGRFTGGWRLYTNTTTTIGVALNAGGSSWNVISDRNAKFGFAPVDEDDLLARLMTLPIQTFYYKDGDGQRYIGPVAQDFHAAFGFGDDDKMIRTMDIDGVTLASIQALGRQMQQLQRDNARLADENAELRRRLDEIVTRLDREERK